MLDPQAVGHSSERHHRAYAPASGRPRSDSGHRPQTPRRQRGFGRLPRPRNTAEALGGFSRTAQTLNPCMPLPCPQPCTLHGQLSLLTTTMLGPTTKGSRRCAHPRRRGVHFLREQGYFRLLGLQLCRGASCPWQCLMF